MGALGSWLADHAFPDDPVFDFWRQRASAGWWCLPEAAYRHFVIHGTQVVPRIRINPSTGTAEMARSGPKSISRRKPSCMPWSGPICPTHPPSGIKKATDPTDWVRGLAPGYLQLGSGQTLGHGIVRSAGLGQDDHPRPQGASGPRRAKPIRPVANRESRFEAEAPMDTDNALHRAPTGKRPARRSRRP